MIFGISGKIGSGKDTVGKIIQYWTAIHSLQKDDKDFKQDYESTYNMKIGSEESFEDFCRLDGSQTSDFIIKKMADTLKDMVCLLINCTREELEDETFKNTPLGEEWTYYAYATGHKIDNNGNREMIATPCSKEKYEEEYRINWQTAYKRELTPRLLMQLLGTDCGRNIIHPNILCNATFASCTPTPGMKDHYKDGKYDYSEDIVIYPNWIITDVRFPNEAEAIKKRNGKMIRINRNQYPDSIFRNDDNEEFVHQGNGLYTTRWGMENGAISSDTPFHAFTNRMDKFNWKDKDQHPSETALDDYEDFDYEIDNNSTIEELIEAVRKILIIEKII